MIGLKGGDKRSPLDSEAIHEKICEELNQMNKSGHDYGYNIQFSENFYMNNNYLFVDAGRFILEKG